MGEAKEFHPQPNRVFVSSVFRGMEDLRQVVGDAAERLGFHAVLTEDLASADVNVSLGLGGDPGVKGTAYTKTAPGPCFDESTFDAATAR